MLTKTIDVDGLKVFCPEAARLARALRYRDRLCRGSTL